MSSEYVALQKTYPSTLSAAKVWGHINVSRPFAKLTQEHKTTEF